MPETPPAKKVKRPPPDGIEIKNKHGQSQYFKYRVLETVEIYQMIDLIIAGNTPAIVGLVMQQNLVWVNSLTRECYKQLVKDLADRGLFQEAMGIADEDPVASVRLGDFRMKLLGLCVSAAEMTSSLTSNGDESILNPSSSQPALTDSPAETTA